jgi:ATP-dependent DNA helicase RecQ
MNLENELLKRFGHGAFRPGQRSLIEALLSKRDALGVMPTGGGKSLCFQLPASILPGTAIVISPLIALMKDQVDALKGRGISAEAYHSGLTPSERRAAREALQSGKLKLLYMAPERMQHEEFMETISRASVSFLTIDEAHCISHWGHDFRPDYRRLGEMRQLLEGAAAGRTVPVMALTATATQRVQEDILEGLRMRDAARVITGFHRSNLSLEVRKCSSRAEKLKTLEELIDQALEQGGSAVIYAATRKNVELVAEQLKHRSVGYYHAGLSDLERAEAQDDFLADRKRVLVATNAFGMGIDKPNVRVVAHFDIPGSVEAYYQEAGRAGRDGLPARCVLLFNYADVATQDFFIQQTWKTAGSGRDDLVRERIQSQQALLKQLVRYAYSTECRQQLVLQYFGDPEAETIGECGHCDACRPPKRDLLLADEFTALAARQALSGVARLNLRFGKMRICEMLKGSDSAGVVSAGLQSQPCYGLLSDWSLKSVRDLIDALLEDEYLKVSGLEYPVLGLTELGVKAMKGEVPLYLSKPPEEASWSPTASGTASPRGKRRGSGEAKAPAREDADPSLVETLKSFRISEAKRLKVPAYVVLHDRTLNELAALKPQSPDALARIHGMGPKKIEAFGERILSILQSGQTGQSPGQGHGPGRAP